MQEFEFRFTCANKKESCANVKSFMDGFKDISDAKNKHFDHTGKILLSSIEDAFTIKEKIETKAGKSLSSIEIAAL